MSNWNVSGGRVLLAAGVVVSAASVALAQFDNSPWPGFAGTGNKHRSVTAPGPVGEMPMIFTGIGQPSYGGITVGSNGDIYFKEYWTNVNGDGTGNKTVVKRLNPNTGEVLAMTANLGGVPGDHGGVAVGVDALYVPIYGGAGNASVYKLDKTDLHTISVFTNPGVWMGIRGTPLIGNTPNVNGHVNIYCVDRDGNQILAIDSVTGAQMGSYSFFGHVLGQLGPLWTAKGHDTFAYFNNSDLGNAVALSDDGAGTLTDIWTDPLAGPGNFNWWGSGALSADGTHIYVTTFNDNDTPTLWALSTATGVADWSVPGNRGQPNEFNFFGRPAVVGNSIYCGGGAAVIAKFTDNGNSYTNDWVRWGPGGGIDPASGPEMTCTSAVQTPDGVYVYSIAQDDNGLGRLDVIHDEGSSFTETFRTNINGMMRWSIYASSSGTIDAAGNLWIGGGRNSDATEGDIYRFSAGGTTCAADWNNDDAVNSQDFFDFLNDFFMSNADFNHDNVTNSQDFFDFLQAFFTGC